MFDLSLLLQTKARLTPRPSHDEAPPPRPMADPATECRRPGERVFTDALSGLGHPLAAG